MELGTFGLIPWISLEVCFVILSKMRKPKTTMSEPFWEAASYVVLSISGSQKSSESTKDKYSPLAIDKPAFLAAPAFDLGVLRTVKR